MNLWEFRLRWDGGAAVDQTLIAEGADEQAAAASAAAMIAGMSGVALVRPGAVVPSQVAMRWREVIDVFPSIVSDAGRLAHYARGLPPERRP
jgi:hypothetical protein